MSFVASKKSEHQTAAEIALVEKDYANAFFHTAKAAEFGLALAEQSEGKIAQCYVEDAFELIEIAGELRAKAQAQGPAETRKVVKETSGDEDVAAKSKWELKDRPTDKLEDVAGLEDVKQELREKVIYPFSRPELHERFKLKGGGGVLMYGPPGNGKTFIARAIAGELDAAFFHVHPAQIKDKYLGGTEKNIKSLFDEARKHEKAVLFLDEAHGLLSRKGEQKNNAVDAFLEGMDGLVQNENCLLVLVATNFPERLDEPTTREGRLGTHIYVGLPDAAAREGIIGLKMKDVPIANDVSFADIASRTDGYTGADMAALCDRSKRFAMRRQLASDTDEKVESDDFDAALEKVPPSLTPDQVKKFSAWKDSAEFKRTGAGREGD